MSETKHRLTIYTLTTAAGSSASLAFNVTEARAREVVEQLADPNAVLRFESVDNHGRNRGATLIPVRMVTQVGYDVGS